MLSRFPWSLPLAAGAILLITMGARQTIGLFVSPLDQATGLGIVSISLAVAIGQFTWGAAQPVSIIVLEGLQDSGNQWGTPVFSFSDGLGNVIGGSAVPVLTAVPAGATMGYPTVGWYRTAYALPAIRSTTYVKIAVSSGGSGSLRGLGQVWILADNGKNAEPSTVLLNGELSGVTGTWLNRSPGLWPANGGQPITAAGTLTVPADATSGLVKVSEP